MMLRTTGPGATTSHSASRVEYDTFLVRPSVCSPNHACLFTKSRMLHEATHTITTHILWDVPSPNHSFSAPPAASQDQSEDLREWVSRGWIYIRSPMPVC